MSDNETWFSQIESKYRSYFSTRMKKALPDYSFNFPTGEMNSTPTKFPTVYFHEVLQTETGNDLDNVGINAVNETIEINVYTNGNMSENRDITAVAVVLMKQLRFNMISAPVYTTEGENIRRSVSRFRRIIGADDGV